jgi:hypothetical protein
MILSRRQLAFRCCLTTLLRGTGRPIVRTLCSGSSQGAGEQCISRLVLSQADRLTQHQDVGFEPTETSSARAAVL